MSPAVLARDVPRQVGLLFVAAATSQNRAAHQPAVSALTPRIRLFATSGGDTADRT